VVFRGGGGKAGVVEKDLWLTKGSGTSRVKGKKTSLGNAPGQRLPGVGGEEGKNRGKGLKIPKNIRET